MSAAFDFLHHKLLSINSLLSTTVLHPGPAKGLLTNFCEVLVSGSAFFLSFSDSLQVATYTAGFFFFFLDSLLVCLGVYDPMWHLYKTILTISFPCLDISLPLNIRNTAGLTAGITVDEDDNIYAFGLWVHQLMEPFATKVWYHELLERCNTKLEQLCLAYPHSSCEPSPPASCVSSGATSPAIALSHVNSPVANVPASAEGLANE